MSTGVDSVRKKSRTLVQSAAQTLVHDSSFRPFEEKTAMEQPPSKDPWSALTPEQRAIVRSRVGTRLRRAMNEGVGFALAAILLLTVCAVSARLTWNHFSRYHDSVDLDFSRTMRATHEPRVDEPYSGILAAVLAPFNSSSTTVPRVDHESEVLRSIAVVHKTFRMLVAEVLGNAEAATAIKHAADNLLPLGGKLNDVALSEEITAVRDGATPVVKERPLGTASIGYARGYGGMGSVTPPAIADAALNFHVLVPSLLDLCPEDEQEECYSDRVKEAIRVSFLLDDVISPAVSRHETENADSTRFVQAYFISVDSVLSIWSEKDKLPENLYPAPRLWAAAHYFQQFLTDDLTRVRGYYTTPSYLDYSGFGMVQTHCTSIVNPTDGRLLGILCTDWTIPQADITRRLTESRLLSFIYLRVNLKDYPFIPPDWPALQAWRPPRSMSPDTPGFPPLDGKAQEGGWRKAESAVPGIAAALTSIAVENRTTLASHAAQKQRAARGKGQKNAPQQPHVYAERYELQRLVTQIPYEGKQSFTVPIGSAEDVEGNYAFNALLITPRTPGPPTEAFWPAVVALTSFVLAGVFVVIGGTLSKTAHRYTERLAVLRTLQAGVVIADGDDIIQEADDRAERDLGVPLPKLGQLESAAGTQEFGALIDGLVVKEDADGNLQAQASPYAQVSQERQRGSWTSYYAKLIHGTRKGYWVHVWASPVSRGRGSAPRVFGVVSRVSPDREKDLGKKVVQR